MKLAGLCRFFFKKKGFRFEKLEFESAFRPKVMAKKFRLGLLEIGWNNFESFGISFNHTRRTVLVMGGTP